MSASTLTELLALAAPPVAIAFVDAPPPGIPHVSPVEPASCGYWRRAAAGEVFFTVAADHKGCPVGAHTHNVPLSPAEQQGEVGLVQTMVNLSYIKMEEVALIPTRKTALKVAVYAPLGAAPMPPEVVRVRGNAHQLMLLAEAALAAGVAGSGATMGRPTCAVVPQAINSDRTAASFGCIGNRVYTGADDTDAYFAVPGSQLGAIVEKLELIVRANQELEKLHRGRLAATG